MLVPLLFLEKLLNYNIFFIQAFKHFIITIVVVIITIVVVIIIVIIAIIISLKVLKVF